MYINKIQNIKIKLENGELEKKVIFQELNSLVVVLGVAMGISIFLFVVFLAVRYKIFKKNHSDIHIRDNNGKYEEFDGVFLPLTEINHYRYYYRY